MRTRMSADWSSRNSQSNPNYRRAAQDQGESGQGRGPSLDMPDRKVGQAPRQEPDRAQNGSDRYRRKDAYHQDHAAHSRKGPGGQHQRDQRLAGAEDEDGKQNPGRDVGRREGFPGLTISLWMCMTVGDHGAAGMYVAVAF